MNRHQISAHVVLSSINSFLRKNFQETEKEMKSASEGEALRIFQYMVKQVEEAMDQLKSELERGGRQSKDKGTQICLDDEEIQRLNGKPDIEQQEDFVNFNFQLRKLQER